MAKKAEDPYGTTMRILEEWRRHRDLSTEEVAAAMLVSPNTWRRYIKRETDISFPMLIRALNFLQVPYDDALKCVTANLRVAKVG